MGVTINSVSTWRRAGAEYLLLDSGAQLHGFPIKCLGQTVPLLDPGIHTASGDRLHFQKDEQFECFSTRVQSRNQFCLLVVSSSRGTGVIFVQTLVHSLFFLDKIQTKHSQTQLHKEESLFFVKGMLVAPLSTIGVTDEVTQELQVLMGPRMLEDDEEAMFARLATLRDSGTPDQIMMEQHSLTHFPSQFGAKMCVESRGRDSPHREQSKIDAVVPQLQFDHGYLGDGGPLQIAFFLVGADTSSGHPRVDGARLQEDGYVSRGCRRSQMGA